MFKFRTRTAARQFKALNNNYKIVDLGESTDPKHKRWGVKVLRNTK